MPLWLARLALSVLAAFLLAQGATYLVNSGALHAAVSAVNPENPRRQLERSVMAAIDHGRADAIVVGRAPFVEAVIASCRLGSRVVPVPIDSPRWRDYWDVLRHVDRLRPSVMVFQGRPYLWTNMQYSWPTQHTTLLPRWNPVELLPLRDVRVVLSTLEEMVQGRSGGNTARTASYDLTGTQYDISDGERFLPRMVQRLTRRAEGPAVRFVLDEVWLLDRALPETRENVLAAFSAPSSYANIEFLTASRFAAEQGCRDSTFGKPGLAESGPDEPFQAPGEEEFDEKREGSEE